MTGDPATTEKRRIGRAFVVLTLVAVAALGVVAPASAYMETSRDGNVGVYSITDTAGSPGATCNYKDDPQEADEGLLRIRAKGFYAHHPSTTKRYVGYRYVITRKPSSSPLYLPVYTSSEVRQLASASEASFFAKRDFLFASPVGNNGGRYRVEIRLTWYGKNGTTVVGTARGLLQAYSHTNPGATAYTIGSEGSTGYCKANFHF